MDLDKATKRSSDQHLKQGQGVVLKTLEDMQEVRQQVQEAWTRRHEETKAIVH